MAEPIKHSKFFIVFNIFSWSLPIYKNTYGVIIASIIAILWIAGYIFWTFTNFFMWESGIVNLISQINVLSLFLAGLALWISGYKHNNRISLIWKHLSHIDRELRLQHSQTNTKVYIFGSVIFWMTLTTCSLINLVNTATTHANKSMFQYGFYVTYFTPGCALYSLFILFVNIAEVVRRRFKCIVEDINKIKGEINDVKLKRQLILLQIAHLEVCNVVHIINTTFGISVLAVIGVTFIQLLTSLYMFAFSLKCLGIQFLFQDGIIHILFLIPSTSIIGYISYICEITTNMVIINKFITNYICNLQFFRV